LVDPDNRRPVDFALRERVLDIVRPIGADGTIPSTKALSDMMREPENGRLKLYFMHKLLLLRRDNATMMAQASVRIVRATGRHADCVLAFERVLGPDSILTVAPRLTHALGGRPIGEAWDDTALSVPTGGVWRCLLSGVETRVEEGHLAVRDLLSVLPVAVLARVH
jgi:(1->4)-alpha-D-glucan 1-alpha-D-glucosylmutase